MGPREKRREEKRKKKEMEKGWKTHKGSNAVESKERVGGDATARRRRMQRENDNNNKKKPTTKRVKTDEGKCRDRGQGTKRPPSSPRNPSPGTEDGANAKETLWEGGVEGEGAVRGAATFPWRPVRGERRSSSPPLNGTKKTENKSVSHARRACAVCVLT